MNIVHNHFHTRVITNFSSYCVEGFENDLKNIIGEQQALIWNALNEHLMKEFFYLNKMAKNL
jgi:hypothetical protein